MRKTFFVVILVFLASFFVIFYIFKSDTVETQIQTVRVYGKSLDIKAGIADTPAKRVQGLSGRKNLGQREGLLFVFENPDIYSFWMKDMLFPIDIIWLKTIDNEEDLDIKSQKREAVIVGIENNVLPETYPAFFNPQTPIDRVLEVNAGVSKNNNLEIGDIVFFEF